MRNSIITDWDGVASAVPIAIVGMGRLISLLGLLIITNIRLSVTWRVFFSIQAVGPPSSRAICAVSRSEEQIHHRLVAPSGSPKTRKCHCYGRLLFES